jgi:hypothetical protein
VLSVLAASIIWIAVLAIPFLAGLFLLPVLIALFRRVDDLSLVILLNTLGGAFPPAWVMALILAARLPPRPPRTDLVWPAPGPVAAPAPPLPSAFPSGTLLVMRADRHAPDRFTRVDGSPVTLNKS